MLIRLFLLLLVALAGGGALYYVLAMRRRGKRDSGHEDGYSNGQLKKLAKRYARLAKARKLSQDILGELDNEKKALFKQRLQTVLGKIAQQEEYREKIAAAVSRAEDAFAEHARKDHSESLSDGLSKQMEHLTRLRHRRSELEEVCDRFLIDLQNLHLSLLEASASQAGMSNETVKTLFETLESSAAALARQSAAEDEVEDFLSQNLGATSTQRKRAADVKVS